MSKGDEWRRDDPDAPWNRPRRGRARRDTRRWCRGKAGVEHQAMIGVQSYGYSSVRGCHPADGWWAQMRGPWVCVHRIECACCGKVLEPFLDWRRCPDLPAELVSA